jgi:hypothetical protein
MKKADADFTAGKVDLEPVVRVDNGARGTRSAPTRTVRKDLGSGVPVAAAWHA